MRLSSRTEVAKAENFQLTSTTVGWLGGPLSNISQKREKSENERREYIHVT